MAQATPILHASDPWTLDDPHTAIRGRAADLGAAAGRERPGYRRDALIYAVLSYWTAARAVQS